MNLINRFRETPKDIFVLKTLYYLQRKIRNYDSLERALNNKSAAKILRNIERERGVLSHALKRQCDEYAIDVLGSSSHSLMLYIYALLHGEFKEGWLTQHYYIDNIRSYEGTYSTQGGMKPLSNTVLSTNLFPDLLYVQQGMFISPIDFSRVDAQEVRDSLFLEQEQVIFKSNSSLQGAGVHFYSKDNFDLNDFKDKNGVFQKVISQHPVFDSIFPYPGATLRITTALDSKGTPKVRGGYLRLGRKNSKVSGSHVHGDNIVKIAVNLSTSKLFETGYLGDWSSTKTHPDTNTRFGDTKIPLLQEACKQLEELHARFPFIRCIGWDMIINSNEELEIMEWNTANNNIEFHEAMTGPCFKDFI